MSFGREKIAKLICLMVESKHTRKQLVEAMDSDPESIRKWVSTFRDVGLVDAPKGEVVKWKT